MPPGRGRYNPRGGELNCHRAGSRVVNIVQYLPARKVAAPRPNRRPGLRDTMWRLKTSLTLLAVVAACLVDSGSARGGDESLSNQPRPQDQIWLVNTRELGGVDCRLTETPRPSVWRYDAAKNA